MEALAFAGFGVAAVVGVITLALRALSAERRAGEQKARADVGDVNQTSLAAMLADSTTREKEAKARGDRLDDALAQMAVEMESAGSAGAYLRLLQKIAAVKSTSGDDHGVVHPPEAAHGGSDTELLKPGE